MEYRIETDIVLKPWSDSFLHLKNDLNLKDACRPENENIRYHNDEICKHKKAKRIHPLGDEATLNVREFRDNSLGIPELPIHKTFTQKFRWSLVQQYKSYTTYIYNCLESIP